MEKHKFGSFSFFFKISNYCNGGFILQLGIQHVHKILFLSNLHCYNLVLRKLRLVSQKSCFYPYKFLNLNKIGKKDKKKMQKKYLSQGATARIKQTGQVVEIKQISDHGVALVKFKTGGQYILLQDRLEGINEDRAEIQH